LEFPTNADIRNVLKRATSDYCYNLVPYGVKRRLL